MFGIMTTVENEEDFYKLKERIIEKINEIRYVDGNSVTLRIKCASRLRTDPAVTDETIYQIAIDDLAAL